MAMAIQNTFPADIWCRIFSHINHPKCLMELRTVASIFRKIIDNPRNASCFDTQQNREIISRKIIQLEVDLYSSVLICSSELDRLKHILVVKAMINQKKEDTIYSLCKELSFKQLIDSFKHKLSDLQFYKSDTGIKFLPICPPTFIQIILFSNQSKFGEILNRIGSGQNESKCLDIADEIERERELAVNGK